jgi:hypothetical protein
MDEAINGASGVLKEDEKPGAMGSGLPESEP